MIKGINHITLTVKDIDVSISFYQDVLKFTAKVKWNSGAYLEAGNIWLCLSKGKPMPSADYSHIAFTVDEKHLSAFKEQNDEIDVWQANSSEGNSIYIKDPDGHKLELHVGSLDSRLKSLETSPYNGLVWLQK